ncbi:carboxypeptidase-like regulatory domain-containing protein [Cellulomonas palmilytica]|uniref:carboxypeptidase-like regulatory domain-containing protein n=1 Tax=Cellulomonas palmilytica TaxID=2608402 RepID=UPI001F3717EA|nr:carboxypeptidase-like regulatory domain-containing protein [Cellulomonas palmilytica]UJP40441.1 carboxypeptidase regulatory-like domain-containing protein [Cellulomonas palmilytica]
MLPRFATVGALAVALVLSTLTPAGAADDTVTYTGRVTVGGATLAVPVHVGWYEPASGDQGSVLTASDGTYALPVPVSTSDWALVANHGSGDPLTYAPEFVGADGRGDHAWQALDLRPDATQDATVDIDLDARGSIAGTATGFAPGHAWVDLKRADGKGHLHDAQRDVRDDGAFEFRDLVPGRYRVVLHPARDDRTITTSAVVTVRPGQQSALPLVASTGGTLTGRLLGFGRPVAGVRVTVHGDGATRQVTTDAQGRYRVPGLPAGTYRVAESGVDNGWSSGSGLVRVRVGATTTRDLTLEREGALVVRAPDLLVVLADVGGNRVRELDRTRVTVPPGRYLLYAASGLRWTRTDVTVRAGKVTDAGTPRPDKAFVSVRGEVTGGDTRANAKKRTVAVCDTLCGGPDGRTATVRADGTYTVSGVVPGVALVQAEQAGWQPGRTVTRIGTSAATNLQLRLTTENARVRGTLRYRGAPVQGSVSFSRSGAVALTRELTGGALDTGTARLAPGTYRMTLDAPAGSYLARTPFWYDLPGDLGTVTVRSGQTLDLGTVEVAFRR